MFACKFCQSKNLKQIVNLGSTPLANTYVKKFQDFKYEKNYPLKVKFCKKCKLIQVPHNIKPNKIFVEYDYLSGMSSTWIRHCEKFFKKITKKFKLKSKSNYILEIGSNDGSLLKFFKQKNFNCIGIEPSKYAAKIARSQNKINTINDFLTPKLARKIVKNKMVNLIIANNVIAHILDIKEFIHAISILCNEKTIISIEFPYALNLFKNLQFDTIYHEHHYYYSLESIQILLKKYNLFIFDLEKINIHGGSIRIFVKKKFNKKIKKSKKLLNEIKKEKKMKIYNKQSIKKFSQKVHEIKLNAKKYLKILKDKNKKISAYGAAAKGNTFLNYCGINNKTIDFIYDENKLKQNKYLPGSKIKILDPKKIKENRPDFIILLPWNIKSEILKTYQYVKKWGCRFIVFIPRLKLY
jgi:hypothetical protein